MMHKNLVLVGLSGAGKTSVGRFVARKLGFSFVDTDMVVEEKAGCTISDIFSRKGEPAFRDMESDVLASFLGTENTVISTGGGIVLAERNRESLASLGVVCWLNPSVATIASYLSQDETRPLLQVVDKESMLQRLFDEREVFYRQVADFEVTPLEVDIAKVGQDIVDKYNTF